MLNRKGEILLSALLLSAMMVVWLGLVGPVNLLALKDWQILVGSLVALASATIAYIAAMAKVNFEKSEAKKQILRERLNLYLRLEYTLQALREQARSAIAETTIRANGWTRKVRLADVLYAEPLEMEHAWESLGSFSSDVGLLLRQMRANLFLLERATKNAPPDIEYDVGYTVAGLLNNTTVINPVPPLKHHSKVTIDLTTKCINLMLSEITKIRSQMEALD